MKRGFRIRAFEFLRKDYIEAGATGGSISQRPVLGRGLWDDRVNNGSALSADNLPCYLRAHCKARHVQEGGGRRYRLSSLEFGAGRVGQRRGDGGPAHCALRLVECAAKWGSFVVSIDVKVAGTFNATP